jgi:hypothetical protein
MLRQRLFCLLFAKHPVEILKYTARELWKYFKTGQKTVILLRKNTNKALIIIRRRNKILSNCNNMVSRNVAVVGVRKKFT